MFIIKNDGQRIIDTNYWDSERCQNGFFYLSWSTGAARLLIPDVHKASLREMKSAKFFIISRGKYQSRDALELLFEDNSDSPYCIQMPTEQCDRLIPDYEQGGGFAVAVWTKSGMKFRLPGKYRTVDTLPFLPLWTEK